MSELVGTPIRGGVIEQLRRRAVHFGKEFYTNRELLYNNARTAWVKLSSSVIVPGREGVARESVLMGGVLPGEGEVRRGLVRGNTGLGSYEDDELRGIVPKPGITSVKVTNRSGYGMVRDAEVQFVLFSREQLDLYDKLYMRPGYTMLLEWGHTVYLNNDGEIDSTDYSIDNFFDLPKKFELDDIFGAGQSSGFKETRFDYYCNKVLERERESSYNYSGMVGNVINFQYNITQEGTYACSTRILGRAGIADKILHIINSPNYLKREQQVKDKIAFNNVSFTGVFNQEYKEEDKIEISHPVRQFCDSILDNYSRDGDAFREQKIRELLNNLFGGLNLDSNDRIIYLQDNEREDLGSSRKLIYIRFYTFLKVLNNLILTKRAGGVQDGLFRVDSPEGFPDPNTSHGAPLFESGNHLIYNKYVTYSDHFSHRPDRFILPRAPKTEVGGKKPFEFFYPIDGSNALFGVFTQYSENRIGNIWVSINYIKEAHDGITVDNVLSSPTLMQFMSNVLADMRLALGRINKFDIHISDYAASPNMYVIDRAIVLPRDTLRSTVIPLSGLGSSVSAINMTSQVPEALTAMIASWTAITTENVKELDSELLKGFEAGWFSYSRGLIDRIRQQDIAEAITEKESESVDPEADNQKPYSSKQLTDIQDVLMDFRGGKSTFNQFDGLAELHSKVSVYEMLLEFSGQGPADFETLRYVGGVLPFKLEVDMMGLSGLFNTNGFITSEGLLPKLTEKFGSFLINGIEHTIGGNTWTTKLSAIIKFNVSEENFQTGRGVTSVGGDLIPRGVVTGDLGSGDLPEFPLPNKPPFRVPQTIEESPRIFPILPGPARGAVSPDGDSLSLPQPEEVVEPPEVTVEIDTTSPVFSTGVADVPDLLNRYLQPDRQGLFLAHDFGNQRALYQALNKIPTSKRYALYIERFLPLAREIRRTYKIPVSICLAQGLHESIAGTSWLAARSNNLFGIKSFDSRNSQVVIVKTGEENPQMRIFNSLRDSHIAYAKFLAVDNVRYRGGNGKTYTDRDGKPFVPTNLFALDSTDYRGWAKGLTYNVYATDRQYDVALIRTIEKYNLQQYDF